MAWVIDVGAETYVDDLHCIPAEDEIPPPPVNVAVVCRDDVERMIIADSLAWGVCSGLRLVAYARSLTTLDVPRESVDVLVVADEPGATVAAHAAALRWMRHGRTPRNPVLYTCTQNSALLRYLSCHGVDAIVGSTDGPAFLHHAVHATHRRDAYHSPAVEQALDGPAAHVTRGARKHQVLRLWPWLSREETDVARLLGYGLGRTETAALLRITRRKAKKLHEGLLATLGARDHDDFEALVQEVGLDAVLAGKRKGRWMLEKWRLGQVLVAVRDGEWAEADGVEIG